MKRLSKMWFYFPLVFVLLSALGLATLPLDCWRKRLNPKNAVLSTFDPGQAAVHNRRAALRPNRFARMIMDAARSSAESAQKLDPLGVPHKNVHLAIIRSENHILDPPRRDYTKELSRVPTELWNPKVGFVWV